MKSPLRWPRRWHSNLSLGWRLALSYTLLTAGVLLIGVLFFIVLWFASSPSEARYTAEELVTKIAPRLLAPLSQEPPDAGYAREILRSNLLLEPGQKTPSVNLEEGSLPEESVVMVLGPDGRMIASVPKIIGLQETGGRVDAEKIPGLSQILAVASAGEEDPKDLYSKDPGNGYTAAAPVKDEKGRVVGVVAEISPNLNSEMLSLAYLLVVIALWITAIAGVLGLGFGFLTAKSLTRRLRALTQASESWSRGEFEVATGDTSGDEIGRLSLALESMTIDLEDLMQSRQDLATLEARNRFARDLHDSVKQQVFAASLQVDTARALDGAAGSVDHLGRANELLSQAHKELDVLIHELRPAMLEGRGLIGALREHAAGWSRGSEIPVEVKVHANRGAPPEVEKALFRVTQEALTNVARHSGADRVVVDLVFGDDAVVLRISDNGSGFDPAGDHAGYGLRSMRERLTKLGGEVRVESAPGQGTSIVCSCPLAESPELPATEPKEDSP